MRITAIAIIGLVIGFIIVITSQFGVAIDAPHNEGNNVYCQNCHIGPDWPMVPYWFPTYTPQTIDDTNFNMLCLSLCHVAPFGPYTEVSAPQVKTHSSVSTSNKYGDWTRECIHCHKPHTQLQNNYTSTDAGNLYLAQGTITSCVYNGGDGTSTLSYSLMTYKPGWNDTKLTKKTGNYRRTALFPNVNNLYYNYPITAVDPGTIKVKGDACTNLIPPTAFAVMYGQFVKDSIEVSGTYKTVKFFDQTGTNSYADGDTTYNGVCEVCHTQTTHFRNAPGASDQTHLNIGGGGAAGTNCITCHPHTEGFKPSCYACHGYPPGFNGGRIVFIDKDANPVTSDSSGVGAHAKHYTVGYVCVNCHTGGMLGGKAQGDDLINIGFNLNSVNLGGTYDGKTGRTFFPYASGGSTSITANGSLECSNLYCHGSTMAPNGGTDITPVWDNPATGVCGTCHGATAANPPTRGSHSIHAASAGGGRQLECTACHGTYPTNHVNGSANVQPGSGTTFTYPGSGACSNISCHNNTDAQWGTSGCLDCHSVSINNRAAIMSQFNANSHHIQAAVTGDKCYQCHWESNSDGTINGIYHGGSGASGSPVDLVIYGSGTRPGTYTLGTTAIQYTANGSRTEIQKINSHCISCHSDQNNAAQPFGDGKTPKQYAWDGTSVDAKYSQTGTTTWGKYTTTANAAKKDITKAYSAHGNAENNFGGGWPDAPSGCSGVNITETICTEFGGTWDGSCVNISASACAQNFCTGLTSSQCGTVGGTWTGSGTACTNISENTCTAGYCTVPTQVCSDPEDPDYHCWTEYPVYTNLNQTTCQSSGGTWTVLNGIWKTGGKWSSGVDYALNSTRGGVNAKNVTCFDCHNSHGSSVSGTTTSYASATTNGGILKDTTAGKGGYSITYKAQSGGSAGNKNAYNPGAGLCFDCHMNASSGTTPWGYSSTFGASQTVMGYGDTPYFGPGTSGPQHRYPYKAGQGNMGGHFGTSSGLSSPPDSSHQITGICTPCHDPHGVSITLGADQQYAAPLLKGTWMTSPYKEDVPPATNAVQTLFSSEGLSYHIDQNTFGPNTRDAVSGISETDTQFAGLCLNCHSKSSLTNGTTHTWKSKDRIHESVKGWKTANGTIKHTYTCSKCHTPHNSSLPRLMATNCLNSTHKGRVGYNNAPVISGSGGGYNYPGPGDVTCYGLSRYCPGYYERMDWGSGAGGGRMPGTWSAPDPPGYNFTVACHESNAADQSWNVKTPWVSHAPTAPTLIDEPSVACASSCPVTLQWNAVTDPDGHAVEYYVQVDDAPDFSSPEYTSGWISGTSATTPALTTDKTYYWRVKARDASDSEESAWSNHDTFTLLLPAPPPVPTLIAKPDAVCASSCPVTLQWYAVSAPDGDSVEYYVQVDDAPDFSSPDYTSGWISGTSATTPALAANKTYYWRVQARDAVHTTQISSWPSYDSFDLVLPPPAPTLIDEPDTTCDSSCSVTLDWNAVIVPDGHAVEYYVEVDDASDFSSPNYNSSWISGASWTPTLPTNAKWYWRVRARDAYANHTAAVSSWSGSDSFRLMTAEPPSAPTGLTGDGCTAGTCLTTCTNTLSWNAVTIPDGHSAEYYVEVSSSSGFTTINYNSGWQAGANWQVTPAAGTWYWRVTARDAYTGHTSAESQPSATGTFTDSAGYYNEFCCSYGDTYCCNPGNDCSSCPFVFAWDGKKYKYVTDVAGTVIGLPKNAPISKAVKLFEPSYLVLNDLKPDNKGQYSIKLRETLYELDYVDEMKLLVIDYPKGYQIVSSTAETTYSWGYKNPFKIYTIKEPVPPISATDKNGNDILDNVLRVDNNTAPVSQNSPDEYYTFDFGKIKNPSRAKLVIDGWSLYKQPNLLKEHKGSIQPFIEVADKNGKWVKARSFGATVGDLKTTVIDIADVFLSDDHRIRLHTGIRDFKWVDRWIIDRIRLDDSEPVEVKIVKEVRASSAELRFGGKAPYKWTTVKKRISAEDGKLPVDQGALSYGKFTEYGDVRELLSKRDDKFVIMRHGDELDITFPGATNQPAEGMERGFILKADLYYKSFENSKDVEPLPFHAMSSYPPADTESYPRDKEHLDYIAKYNTREYTLDKAEGSAVYKEAKTTETGVEMGPAVALMGKGVVAVEKAAKNELQEAKAEKQKVETSILDKVVEFMKRIWMFIVVIFKSAMSFFGK